MSLVIKSLGGGHTHAHTCTQMHTHMCVRTHTQRERDIHRHSSWAYETRQMLALSNNKLNAKSAPSNIRT